MSKIATLIIRLKNYIKKIPFVGGVICQIYRRTTQKPFDNSERYWLERYDMGGNSGCGSYGELATWKAKIINHFIIKNNVKSVIEFGCGDGNQLRYSEYPEYLGFDISKTALSLCRNMFLSDKSKTFKLMQEYNEEKADLTLSLDVIYHLVEDEVYCDYMKTLFNASNQYVIVYSSNSDNNIGYEGTHVKHRIFTEWIQENESHWRQTEHIANKNPYQGDYKTSSFADFFIYEKI